MLVKSVCSENPQYVSPDTPLTEVAERMKQHDCGTILVGEGDKLTGIITDRDIVIRCIAKWQDPATMTADQCKTPKILYCTQSDEAETVLEDMARNEVRRMVVLDNRDDKNLVGIVSFGDLSVACNNKEVPGQAMEALRRAA